MMNGPPGLVQKVLSYVNVNHSSLFPTQYWVGLFRSPIYHHSEWVLSAGRTRENWLDEFLESETEPVGSQNVMCLLGGSFCTFGGREWWKPVVGVTAFLLTDRYGKVGHGEVMTSALNYVSFFGNSWSLVLLHHDYRLYPSINLRNSTFDAGEISVR